MLRRTPLKSLLLFATLLALARPLPSAEVDGRSGAQLLRKSFVSEVSGEERDYYLPIWIITGGKDRTVLPEWVLASAKALEEAGHPDVRFTVHGDRPHDVWTRVYEGWDLYNWFLNQRRK